MAPRRDIRKVVFHLLGDVIGGDVIGHALMQLALVSFERQNILTFAANNLFGNRALASRGVDLDDCSFEFEII